MPQSSYIYLTLAGDFVPNEVAAHITLASCEGYMKHSRSKEHRIPRVSRLDFGRLDTVNEVPDIYELSEKLVDILEPHASEFQYVTDRFELECCCSICLWFPHDNSISTPAIGFSKRVTGFLASVNASIDIDTYRKWDESGEQN